jgi:hypothetical protein
MVRVTTVANPVTARILAAQLGAEGVVWELRGVNVLYPVGPVELLVDEDDVDVARDVLTAVAVADPADSPDPADTPDPAAPSLLSGDPLDGPDAAYPTDGPEPAPVGDPMDGAYPGDPAPAADRPGRDEPDDADGVRHAGMDDRSRRWVAVGLIALLVIVPLRWLFEALL